MAAATKERQPGPVILEISFADIILLLLLPPLCTVRSSAWGGTMEKVGDSKKRMGGGGSQGRPLLRGGRAEKSEMSREERLQVRGQ